ARRSDVPGLRGARDRRRASRVHGEGTGSRPGVRTVHRSGTGADRHRTPVDHRPAVNDFELPGMWSTSDFLHGETDMEKTTGPIVASLDEWWTGLTDEDIRKTVPKTQEYGSKGEDMVELGRHIANVGRMKPPFFTQDEPD